MCSCSNGKRVEGREALEPVINCIGGRLRSERTSTWEKGDGGTVALGEAQALVVRNSPFRLAMAFEYFRITGMKDLLQVHSFQMRSTVPSERPRASGMRISVIQSRQKAQVYMGSSLVTIRRIQPPARNYVVRVLESGPTWTVDRTIFEMWLGAL